MSQINRTRNSSEYSRDGSSSSSVSAKIKVDDNDQKRARAKIYGYLFRNWWADVALIPSLFIGAIPIIMYVMFGRIVNALTQYYMTQLLPTPYDPMDEIFKQAMYLVALACAAGVARFLDSLLWIRNGSYLSTKLKRQLFTNMMKNEVTFFDVNPIGGILTLLSEDAQQVEDAFGLIKGQQVQNLGQFIVGIVMAFVYYWQMALIALASIPVIGIVLGILMPGIVKQAGLKFLHIANAMTIAEETLSAARTVKGCNREDKELERFMKSTKLSAKAEVMIGVYIIVIIFTIQFVMWGDTIGNLYFGAWRVSQGKLEVGDLFSVFGFSVFGVFGIIQLQGTLQGEQKAIAAGARILKLTEHEPAIPFEGGETIEDFKGHIEFRNVSFKYPTRDVYVLRNVSFEIKPCQMGALVGHSGSGKSTSVQLLERYYDCEEGLVLLDGKDIRTLDPRWLHRKIGLVQQEPMLFQMSIRDNIKYGARDATDDDVYAAAEIANAKKFVDKLDKGFDQQVGEKGSALSGGQRQRIAIARAVIKDPVILICDEATSALDADSEKKVQRALDKVMERRTSVVVAHRLSTIRNANIIYVFDSGEIKEQGTHDELLAKGEWYYNLVKRQLSQETEVKEKSKVPAAASAPKEEAEPPKVEETKEPEPVETRPPEDESEPSSFSSSSSD